MSDDRMLSMGAVAHLGAALDQARAERDTALTAVLDWKRAAASVEVERGAALARLADVWDEAAEATAEWMANNPSPAGIPADPPRNPYADEWTADPEGGA